MSETVAIAAGWANLFRELALAGMHQLGAIGFASPCLVCRDPLSRPLAGPLCPSCEAELNELRIEPPYCPGCGLPYAPGVAGGRCGACREAPAFRIARAGAVYEGSVKLCLQELKFGRRERLAAPLTDLALRWVASGELRGFSAVVPVPLSRHRRRERGFNQAERIARIVARHARVRARPAILQKTSDRPPQSGLGALARRRNVAGAFRARLPRSLEGKRLLLVDDIFTTGATADACARALKRSGAGAVDVLTVARVR